MRLSLTEPNSRLSVTPGPRLPVTVPLQSIRSVSAMICPVASPSTTCGRQGLAVCVEQGARPRGGEPGPLRELRFRRFQDKPRLKVHKM